MPRVRYVKHNDGNLCKYDFYIYAFNRQFKFMRFVPYTMPRIDAARMLREAHELTWVSYKHALVAETISQEAALLRSTNNSGIISTDEAK